VKGSEMNEIVKNVKVQIEEINQYIDTDESINDLTQRGIAITLRNQLMLFVKKYELMINY
jgi:hypothetical protein|tara:strand:+ start:4472 stop:4651 length:180 start_codon:yes stop_codon:yes gene_type:complete